MQKRELAISGSKEKPISLDITYVKNGHVKPIVILCHGFKGFKDWGHFNLIAEEFAKGGFVFLKFTMSHSGTTSEHPTEFVDLETFGHNNFMLELEDTGRVIDYAEKNAGDFEGDRERIFLIGHSRGGGIAILKAAEDSRVRKLVTWASVRDIADFFKNQELETWKSAGKIYSLNSRTQQNMPLYFQIYENYVANKERLNIPRAAASISIPWLIMHGSNDSSVPVEYAHSLHHWNSGSTLLEMQGADHSFGGKHPWTETSLPEYSQQLIQTTIDFLKR